MEVSKLKDENAVVLDIIKNQNNFSNNTILLSLGLETFSLLELVPKNMTEINIGETVYIGNEKRDKIQYIKRVLYYDKLSEIAKDELEFVLIDVVKNNEKKFIKFFNICGLITIRKHSLELIKTIGKKHLKEIIEEREIKEFESFEDMKKRCPFMNDIEKGLSLRLIEEIKNSKEIKILTKINTILK